VKADHHLGVLCVLLSVLSVEIIFNAEAAESDTENADFFLFEIF